MSRTSAARGTSYLPSNWSTDPSREESSTEAGSAGFSGQDKNGLSPGNISWSYLTVSASDDSWPLHWKVFCGSVLVVAHLGNAWVLYKGFRQKTTRRSTFHLLLMSHSLTCFLLATFVYPVSQYMVNVGMAKSYVESKFCHYGYLGMLWWVSAGLFINGAVAINRAMSCYPHWAASRLIRRHRVTWLIIAGIFLLTFLMYGVVALKNPVGWSIQFWCVPFWDVIQGRHRPDVQLARRLIHWFCGQSIVVALILSLSSYLLIIWHLYGQRKAGTTGALTVSTRRRREKLHALGVIVTVFGCFLVCWTPTIYALVWKPALLSKVACPLLAVTETAVTPIVYVTAMETYRPAWCMRRDRKARVAPTGGSDTVTGSGEPKSLQLSVKTTTGV